MFITSVGGGKIYNVIVEELLREEFLSSLSGLLGESFGASGLGLVVEGHHMKLRWGVLSKGISAEWRERFEQELGEGALLEEDARLNPSAETLYRGEFDFSAGRGKFLLLLPVSDEAGEKLAEFLKNHIVLILESLLKAERRLSLFAELLEESAEGVLLANPDGSVVFENRAAAGLVHLIKRKDGVVEEIGGRAWKEIVGELGRGELSFEVSVEEENRYYSIRIKGLEGSQVLVKILDITQTHLLMESVAREERLASLGRLATSIAHEFNNRLNTIINLIELAKGNPEETQDYLEDAKNEALRAADVVRRLLRFARGERFRAVIDLVTFLRDMVRVMRATFPENIEIELKAEEGIYLVEMDIVDLETVIMNVAVNAKEAMPDGGRLTFYLSSASGSDGDYVCITVQDTGRGMSPEVKRRIFEPFFTTKKKGTGLGLFHVQEIVKSSGGWIEVDSKEGEGTTFRIYLPAAKRKVEEVKKEEEVSGRLPEGLKILLAEDDEKVRNTLEKLLRQLGAEVETAKDGVEALQIYDREGGKFDLVIADNVMPRMNGVELFIFLKNRNPDVRMILITGYSQPIEIEKMKDSGIREILMKPFGAIQLRRAIQKALQ